MDSAQEITSNVQLEQNKLLKTEKILKQLLTKINENLNALTVEELQLKANSVISDIKPKNLSTGNVKPECEEYFLPDKLEEINKQSLCLNVFDNSMMDQQEYDSS